MRGGEHTFGGHQIGHIFQPSFHVILLSTPVGGIHISYFIISKDFLLKVTC
jgi:hypothetical protein